MIKEKKVTVIDIDGEKRTYILSRIPSTEAREIYTQYLPSAAPTKFGGDYKLNEELVAKMMCYVQVEAENGAKIALTTRTLRDNHIPDFDTHLAVEKEMAAYNVGFFQRVLSSGFLRGIPQILKALIIKTSTDSSAPSSAKIKQP